MGTIRRFSSRKHRLDKAFLAERLKTATSYRRIAGYFRSSIFELVGEELEGVGDVRIVCNSELDAADIAVSKAARETALKARWNDVPVEVEALLHRDRYRKLYDLLVSGRVKIKVVPKDQVFLHGKAGVIEGPDGKVCFLGSINETRSAFAKNYEILWEDTSPEGIAWVEAEFEALWEAGHDLPDAIVEEIKRVADRVEIRFEKVEDQAMPGAALAETPLYRNGFQLRPWQRAFVALFLEHRETFGKARLLLADEVGLGKTLSLAAAAMVSALLNDGPVLILCPSTLTIQWQVELLDHLGIPSAVWHSNKKIWLDPSGHAIKTRGAEDIGRCPFRVAIVSTGLVVNTKSKEREVLLGRKYGTVVLDEAHKARRKGGLGQAEKALNNLLDFMIKIGPKTRNLLLGTATPIQTDVRELWDLMAILNSGADHVTGRAMVSRWRDWEQALPVVKGDQQPADEREAWELLRNPLPPTHEHQTIGTLRSLLKVDDREFFSSVAYGDLDRSAQMMLSRTLAADFFREHNPIIRHTVLRRRDTLEEEGLLERVGVVVHPEPDKASTAYPGVAFTGLGLLTNHPFNLAYEAAESFTELLGKRIKAAGFMKSLLLQRICSSFASGKSTARKLLDRELIDDDEDSSLFENELDVLKPKEAQYLEQIIGELERPEARDPKLDAVKYFLTQHKVGQGKDSKTFLEHGCIIFSQYYDTAFWIASELAKVLGDEVVAVYAGVGKSGLFRQQEFAAVKREDIKSAVKKRELRLVVATDAACEGLNLQTLGTLINVDLPWNPARLEQRLGRIKRFGQARRSVDMVNLVYHDTRDEKVYETLSRRMKDTFDIFGGLPDTIEDDWIESQDKLEERMNTYVHLRDKAKDVFELRYKSTIHPDAHRWELCSDVLSRSDIIEKLSEPW